MGLVGDIAKYPPLLYMVILLSAVGGFLFGYDTGVIAGALPLVEETDGFFPVDKSKGLVVRRDGIRGRRSGNLTDTIRLQRKLMTGRLASRPPQWELHSCSPSLEVLSRRGRVVSTSYIMPLAFTRWGRKKAIISAAVVFTVGAIVMGAAPNKEVLLVGRIVLGMGIGMASMCVPVYMAETSPEDIRGFLGASFQVMICFGQVTSALVDALFSKVSVGWRWDFGLAAIPGVILLLGFFFCPESPRWLVKEGRIEEARAVLKKLRSDTCNIEEELQEIIKVAKEDEKVAQETGNSFKRMMNTPSVRKALILGVTLQLFQQLAGINTGQSGLEDHSHQDCSFQSSTTPPGSSRCLASATTSPQYCGSLLVSMASTSWPPSSVCTWWTELEGRR